MYTHKDELLYDPLPQPYRYINKIILRCIEDAVDLVENGGITETFNSFINHNLKLTKVGNIPAKDYNNYFLSTSITNQEITIYRFLGNTNYLVVSTAQGIIYIYDFINNVVSFTLNISTLSKTSQPKPICKLHCFETDFSNYVIAFTTEESGFILFISDIFQLKASIELDLSLFIIDSIVISSTPQHFLSITDGTGRTQIYNCHVPYEHTHSESSTFKSQPCKSIQLEPIFDLEKCPISNGPVSSTSQITTTKVVEVDPRKRPIKRRLTPLSKGKSRLRPSSTLQSIETAPIELNYHSFVHVFEKSNVVLIRFGSLPILLMYSLGSNSKLLCEFPLPSPVSCALEIDLDNVIVLGFENGSFCFLNVSRKALYDHQFPKQGPIISFHYENNFLMTFTSNKILTIYEIENFKISKQILECIDDDIIKANLTMDTILTYNQKTTDVNLIQALTHTLNWNEREFHLFPNLSFFDPYKRIYLGTIALPINLKLINFIWNENYIIFVFDDPVEYRTNITVVSPPSSRSKRTQVKSGKTTQTKRRAASRIKKEEEVEQEPLTVVLKRHIIAIIDIKSENENFRKLYTLAENEKQRRREILRSLSSRSKKSQNEEKTIKE